MPKIKISVFGAKMLLGPETPGISPDTPGLGHSGENSGYRPGNSGLGGSGYSRFLGNVLGLGVQFLCKLLIVASSHWLF